MIEIHHTRIATKHSSEEGALQAAHSGDCQDCVVVCSEATALDCLEDFLTKLNNEEVAPDSERFFEMVSV